MSGSDREAIEREGKELAEAGVRLITAAFLAGEEMDRIKAENEALKEALQDLLEDTQHAGHDCGDTPEHCPVLAARALLERLGA